MINPLNYVPAQVKTRLIDNVLTKLAEAVDASGSPRLARTLRDLRSDTPFIEDVAEGLGRALESFALHWQGRDPQFTAILVAETEIWKTPEFLGGLAASLMRPIGAPSPVLDDMTRVVLVAVAGRVPDDRVTRGVGALLSMVREELFAHPKLQAVHSLFLQAFAVSGQVAILEELRAMRRDNVAALTTLRPADDVTVPALTSNVGTLSGCVAGTTSGIPLIVRVTSKTTRRMPDVLTPALTGQPMVAPAYEPVVGREAAAWLGTIQDRVTGSVETADFKAQQRIAEELLQHDVGLPSLTSSAYYLLGEARRLQADTMASDKDRSQLLNAACDSYGTALDLDETSPRALRGLARIQEVRGDIGGALKLYEQARIGALHAYVAHGGAPESDSSHEVLRSTRHYAACLSQSIIDAPSGAWLRESQRAKLRGSVLESDDLHRDILPRFAAYSGWMRTEWFMGLVLLAKSYAVIGDQIRAWLSMLHALAALMGIMDPTRHSFAPTEPGNPSRWHRLLWWHSTARIVRSPMSDFDRLIEVIGDAVQNDDATAAWLCMQEIVQPIRSPWSNQREGMVY